MVYFPEVQAKVQQELDEVLGQSVLPDFSDEDSLPYLNATVKEVLRWVSLPKITWKTFRTTDILELSDLLLRWHYRTD